MATARSPGPVPQEALDYFRAKDLRPGFDYRDVWGEEHAHAFTVAKALRLDILEDIRSALDAALAEGQTFRQFAKEIKPTLQRKGWWGIKAAIDPATGEKRLVQLGSPRRLKTIYRANLRSARAAGQWQRIQRTKASQPYLVYLLGPSRNHRDAHVTLQGLTLPVDDPAWQTVYPPNGYNCKCHIRQITRAAADDYQRDGVPDATAAQEMDPATGLPTGRRVTQRVPALTSMPALKQKRWVNKRSGEVSYAPEGIHPGWANNSGQARVRVLREHLIGRMDSADEHLARYAVLDVVGSPVYRAFRRDVARYRELLRNRDLPNAQRKARAARIGEFPVGVLRRDDMARLGLHTQMVRLSPEDFAKQVAKHGELGRDDYLAVVDALDRGRAAYDAEDGKLFYFLRVADSTSEKGDPRRYRMALVRITKDRRKLYLQSYRIARQQDVDAAMAALEPLRRREEKEKR